MAEAVQYLISAGHSWSEIKQYPLQTMGAFIVAANRVRSAEWKLETTGVWIGSNATQDGLKKVLEDTPQAKSHGASDKSGPRQRAEFARLAAHLSSLGRK